MGERKYCYKCMEKYDSMLHVCPNCGYDEYSGHNPMYIAPGTVLHDRYLVGVLLEYNGEGATYICHDIATDCKVLLREYMPINLCTRVRNKAVISVLSPTTVMRIVLGGAPMALRIPNSLVRSFTLTSMMLLTPTAPETKVHRPMMSTKIRMAFMMPC